jgi:hypothetical protein
MVMDGEGSHTEEDKETTTTKRLQLLKELYTALEGEGLKLESFQSPVYSKKMSLKGLEPIVLDEAKEATGGRLYVYKAGVFIDKSSDEVVAIFATREQHEADQIYETTYVAGLRPIKVTVEEVTTRKTIE